MTQKQAENLDELARAGLRGWPKGDGMCPECGEKPAKMTSNLVNGDVVYTCPIGHEWVSDETQRSRPVETAAADKGTQSRKRAKD